LDYKTYPFGYSICDTVKRRIGQLFSCPEGSYPEIDFAKYDLIFAAGMATSSPAEVIKRQLYRISGNEYSLYCEIRPGPALTPGPWVISILAPKLSQNAIISLDVNQHSGYYSLDGYVVGFESCSGTRVIEQYGEANAYYIISSDLKDTLLTYNFPKDIFHFPLECIKDANYMVTPVWFPDTYRYAFKVHIEYEIVPENEKQYAVCKGNVLIRPAGQGIQIDIKSATKIE
jgi:hypothetical protein